MQPEPAIVVYDSRGLPLGDAVLRLDPLVAAQGVERHERSDLTDLQRVEIADRLRKLADALDPGSRP